MLWGVLFKLKTQLFYKKEISKFSVFGLLPLPAFFNWKKNQEKSEQERLTGKSQLPYNI